MNKYTRNRTEVMIMFPEREFHKIANAISGKYNPNVCDYSIFAKNEQENSKFKCSFATAGGIDNRLFPTCYTGLCFVVFFIESQNCDVDVEKMITEFDIDPVVTIVGKPDIKGYHLTVDDSVNELAGTCFVSESTKSSSQFFDAEYAFWMGFVVADTLIEMQEKGKATPIER